MTGVLLVLFGAACTAALFLAILRAVLVTARMPALYGLPIGMTVSIGVLSVCFNLLSVFRAVSFWPLLTCVTLLVTTSWFVSRTKRGQLHRVSSAVRAVGRWRLRFSPLIIALALIAVVYPPNNWDSMSYHMARVAHWIQHGSVAYYATPLPDQNLMGPGAEYLILLTQVLTRSDVLANLVQLCALVACLFGLWAFLRHLGLRKTLAGVSIALATFSPMLLNQATSTQNDLVAANCTLSTVLVAFLLSRSTRRPLGLWILLGVSVSASLLVKPTSLVVACPFLALMMFTVGRRVFSNLRSDIVGLCGFAVVAVAICGPDLARKHSETGSFLAARHEVWPLTSDWTTDRILNIFQAGCYHLFPRLSDAYVAAVRLPLRLLGSPSRFPFRDSCEMHASFHEDLAGNPFQFYVLALASLAVVGVLIWHAVRTRTPGAYRCWIALCPAAAFALLAVTVKDQAWITRLQTPVFVLLPLTMVFLVPWQQRLLKRRGFAVLALVLSTVVGMHGMGVLFWNTRPFRLLDWLAPTFTRIDHYYTNLNVSKEHQIVLETLRSQNCTELGLAFVRGVSNDFDYPITWRAMRQGVTVHHVTEPGSTPCVVYSTHGRGFPGNERFAEAAPGVYVRMR
jgi:Dolichyl-phosphate-mannose-protein mannosyltransferase